MKQIYLKGFILCLCLFAGIKAYAYQAYIDGIYYDFSGENATVTYGSGYSGDVVIPESVIYNGGTYRVTSIGNHAFHSCTSLTSVTIPNSVISIGNYAFNSCTSLTSVTIPNSVTSISSSAFEGCYSITSLDIDCENVSNWFSYSKDKIETLTLGNHVKTIGQDAFNSYSSLISISFGDGLTSIGSNAFYGTAWYNNQPDGIIYAGKLAYKYKGTIPSGTKITIQEGTLGIADYAFLGCSGLTSVTIPNSVTSIGEGAFYNCSGLTSITIPNSVTSIGKNAFSGCSGLTSVNIGSGVTSFGENAFDGCSNITSLSLDCENVGNWFYGNEKLRSLTFGGHVKSINSSAFSGCTGLNSLIIPKNVTSIGASAFWGCSGLTSIKVENGNTSFDSRNECNAIIETATNTLFLGCKNTTIPDNLTGIRDYAFYGCSGLTTITIPNKVKSIGDYAFYNCSGLTSVTIPYSVTSIGSNAFRGCLNIISLSLDCRNISNWFSGNVNLRSLTLGEHVKIIGSSAFSGFSALNSITIPNNVTDIGDYAFQGCSSLTSIAIPNNVTNIGSYAFYGCSGLRTVYISDISAWLKINFGGQYANPLSYSHHLYMNDKEVSKLVIPNGTEQISAYAFDGCESLSSVVIPNTIKRIGAYAFRNCTDLGSVTCLIKTPFQIDNSVFSCDGNYIYDTVYMLATLFVPRGRENFYAQLEGWKKFVSIQTTETQFTITYILDGEPYKVYEIQATDVVTPEPAPVKEDYIFSGWSDIPWYMPAENVTVYGYFTFDPDAIGVVKADDVTEQDCYDLNGRKLDRPQKGINIIRMSDGTTRKVMIK